MNHAHAEHDSLVINSDGLQIRIEAWGDDSLRVRTARGTVRDSTAGALLGERTSGARVHVAETKATIVNGAIRAEVDFWQDVHKILSSVRFLNEETGEELLAEAAAHFPRDPARSMTPLGGDLFRAEQRFKAYDHERLYGLGQHQHGRLDQKGAVIDLAQINTEVTIPFLVSSRGYGFLWNNPAIGRVELGTTQTRWVAEASHQIDYWVTTGETPAAIMENYTAVVGRAPLLPSWAAGYWQCKLRYRTQHELLEVAREHKRRGLPLSVIVIDYFHWPKQGDWRFDSETWPDPAGMVRELSEMDVKLMVSVWPTVNAASENFLEMRDRGLLVDTESGISALMSFTDNGQDGTVYVHYYDATNPEARDFIWTRVQEGYHQHGVAAYWLDACEPELLPRDFHNVRYSEGNGLEVNNIYPLLHARAFYEGMEAAGDTEIINLCRSAWAGSQRYGAALWSGDVQSTFEEFRTQIPAGLNAAMSGIPWWTTDIGGFFGGDIREPEFHELLIRWFQYGAFCPLFRMHGSRLPATGFGASASGAANEVWSFGEEVYEILVPYLELRERLRPYIMEQMAVAAANGTPPMRPLFYDYPDDQRAWDVEDQFMLGPDLLIAPVLHAGERERGVYLPEGPTWACAWTGATHEGGQVLVADAPLDRIPVYAREGASLDVFTRAAVR